MTQTTEYQPKPSGKSSRFFLHLSNWSEFFIWFSMGVGLSFVSQILPAMWLLYPIGFVFGITYWGLTWNNNQLGNTLRIAAIIFSLIGYWNLAWLYRDSFAVIAIITIVLSLGVLYLWLTKR